MHIIITHSNADFDAVASLLAAWRLYPDAVPVLPSNLNRNVRDFVNLYQNQLPFSQMKELDKKPISQVTIVDSQHLPTLSRLEPDASLHIIDHHDLQESRPQNATLSLTDTGANVTLLIEKISRLGQRLSPLEATLMMLGIYEDTGSLTYTSTTPRDLQCAAWLLSEGQARLDIVREYLNYPLSDAQRDLYEQLIDSLETYTVQGHTILISVAQVKHYVEEISSVAQRIRDLYQPDALFILVKMTDHVQLVARSTTDAVDVAHISKFFEGGGHPRASAALIKEKSLEEIKKKMIRLLRLEVKPAITVAQLMSKGVRTLAPKDTVRHAAKMMDRYGHEGFPVVKPEQGQIVGVLSRREVDKARRHELDNAPIDQFMKKGNFFVVPEDSIEAVQNLMTEQRIGQVPVVDKAGGELIGIVTRTDLINLWQSTTQRTRQQTNLTDPLKRAISEPLFELLQETGQVAVEQGDTLYIVGGFVRDLLLMMMSEAENGDKARVSPRFDLDLVVEGQAIALAESLQKRHGGRIHSHQRFGTAKWVLAKPIPFISGLLNKQVTLTSLDFVTARTEFYRHPTALPEVERSSIGQDLHRRDFTINTLALRLTPDRFGELLDFYGGQSDLQVRLIRVLHSLSFVEDPTRMLRAARLMVRLGFRLEERTSELLTNALGLIQRVSGERIISELELIFKERYPEEVLTQLDELGVLEAIHSGLMVDEWLITRIRMLRNLESNNPPWQKIKPKPIHYLGLMAFWLAGDEQELLMERLNLRNRQRTILREVYRVRRSTTVLIEADLASALYHLLAPTTEETRLIAWLGMEKEAARQQIIRFETELKDVKPMVDGTYLKETFALRPGPIYGQILESLRDARLDGLVSSLADERAMVEQILAERKDQTP